MDFLGIGEESERFFRAMLQLSNSPILITDAQAPDNPIVFVNPAFEHVTGYFADEVIGRNCRLLQNDDREQTGRAVVSDAIRTGTPCGALFRNYRKNGQLFWTRLYMFPVTAQSEITHFVGIQHDVTAETELVRALEENLHDGACRHGRPRRDYRHRRVLYGRILLPAPACRVRGVCRAAADEP